MTTFNEAENVEECLRSLAWCDEIVVVDSFSSDSTLDIIGRFPDVKVLQRTYYGAASQKNWAIDRLSHDWVLILDADERVTPELRTEIEGILGSPSPAGAYSVKRRVFALGKQIRFSGWQNDSVVRLFRRDAARYPNRRVHADMMTRERPKCLEEYLDHHMVSDLAEYFKRIQRYSWWGAAQLWRGRRRAGFSDIVLRPAWRFLRTYVLQLGFMEGQRGIVMCGLQSYGAFLKYAILWGWQIQAKRGKVPRLPEFDDDSSTWAWHKNDSSSSVFWPNTEVRVETTQQP
ncbi:MAG: glycosyltransferase family 2 protein [bacterium]|nr:glycosyltransferase family 2 protein [bacterium]